MLSSLLVTFVGTALALPSQASDPVHVPLSHGREIRPRSVTAQADTSAYFTELNGVLRKYNSTLQVPSSVSGIHKRAIGRALAPGNVALTNQVDAGTDVTYYSSYNVGNQAFTLIFDTGSCNLFVPGPNCASCAGKTTYGNTGTDQHTQTSVTYGSGAIAGENYQDTVTCAGF